MPDTTSVHIDSSMPNMSLKTKNSKDGRPRFSVKNCPTTKSVIIKTVKSKGAK